MGDLKVDMEALALRKAIYFEAAELAMKAFGENYDMVLQDVAAFAESAVRVIVPAPTQVIEPLKPNRFERLLGSDLPVVEPAPAAFIPEVDHGKVQSVTAILTEDEDPDFCEVGEEKPFVSLGEAAERVVESVRPEPARMVGAERVEQDHPLVEEVPAPTPYHPKPAPTDPSRMLKDKTAAVSHQNHGWDNDLEERLFEMRQIQSANYDVIAKELGKTEGACRAREYLMKDKGRWVKRVTDKVLAAHPTQGSSLNYGNTPAE